MLGLRLSVRVKVNQPTRLSSYTDPTMIASRRQDKTRQDKTRQDKTNKTRQDKDKTCFNCHPFTVFFSDVFFSYGTYNKTKDLTNLRGPPPPLRQPHNDPYYCFTSRWHLFLTTPPVLFPPFWFLVGLISLLTTVFCIQYIFFGLYKFKSI